MMKRIAVLSLFLALFAGGRILAHEGHQHNMLGTVTAVEADHLDMDTKEGAPVSILVSKDTKCFKGEAPASLSDIKAGDRVVVSVVKEGDKLVAREIRMAAAKS